MAALPGDGTTGALTGVIVRCARFREQPTRRICAGATVPSQSLHGYYFQPVIASDSQGGASNRSAAAAPAFVAYPAQYRASAVMAFIVTRDGSVFEKDLGNDTAKIAKSISSRSLDSSWQVVE